MTKKSNKLNISFVLDETGSMFPVANETIDGFNKYLKDIKAERKGKPTSFTLTLFNTRKTEIRYDAVPLGKVKKLNDETYCPDAYTPLYDAIGKTVRTLESSIGKKGKAIVVILTDGDENSSKEWTQKSIFQLIEKKQKEGWAFVYLGANQDAWLVGAGMGITLTNISSYDQDDPKAAFAGTRAATVTYASSGGEQTSDLLPEEEVDKLTGGKGSRQ